MPPNKQSCKRAPYDPSHSRINGQSCRACLKHENPADDYPIFAPGRQATPGDRQSTPAFDLASTAQCAFPQDGSGRGLDSPPDHPDVASCCGQTDGMDSRAAHRRTRAAQLRITGKSSTGSFAKTGLSCGLVCPRMSKTEAGNAIQAGGSSTCQTWQRQNSKQRDTKHLSCGCTPGQCSNGKCACIRHGEVCGTNCHKKIQIETSVLCQNRGVTFVSTSKYKDVLEAHAVKDIEELPANAPRRRN
ncbi:hypothetical protein EK21DRAFT_94653 [Setomelanomma holmii]|uniref:Uncharacterized protein n=1 Tax=Setomelanomma holmii TaxID=210430 RepID=A0A9P4LGP1_9PLEO|nr:hypothetical protein EK21DRAFT_94653 [Setomelanomma holmii]